MRQSWGDFLKGAGTHSHGVQVYDDAVDLADSVAAYLVAGFERDQPAMLVATPEHLSLFAERLATRGWELGDTESAGLLVVADAEETLAGIVGRHGLDRGRFERAVADMLDRIHAGPGVQARVFGEMVDVLSRRGDADTPTSSSDSGTTSPARSRSRSSAAIASMSSIRRRSSRRCRTSAASTLTSCLPGTTHASPARWTPRCARCSARTMRRLCTSSSHARSATIRSRSHSRF